VAFSAISSILNGESPERWVHLHVDLTQSFARSIAVKSQIEVYRGKAKEYARRTILTKSRRESRRCRKLAEMYWALALNEEPESVRPSKMIVKTSPT
jgi:hypothetical protein